MILAKLIISLLVPCDDPTDTLLIDPYFDPSEVNIIKVDGLYVGNVETPKHIYDYDNFNSIDSTDSIIFPFLERPKGH